MLGFKSKDKEDNAHKEDEKDMRQSAESKGQHLENMPVVKVIELIGTSPESFDDAIAKGIGTAAASLRHITGADIKRMTVAVKDGKIHQYKVNLKVAFALAPEEDDD